MKKILAILATVVLSLTACADRHQLVESSELPAQAQAFIKLHFNMSDITYVERDRDGVRFEYKVYFKDATEVEFDYQGNLKSVDCHNKAVPVGIIPESIVTFVQTHYSEMFIVEYGIDYRRLTVELNNGIDLLFDLEGNFLYLDD